MSVRDVVDAVSHEIDFDPDTASAEFYENAGRGEAAKALAEKFTREELAGALIALVRLIG